MLRKSVVLGSVLTAVCASSTLAHSSFYKSGFLAGAHVGVANGSGSFNSNVNPNAVGFPADSKSGRGRKTSALIGILGGYRHIFNQDMTIGLDISLNFLTNNEIKKQIVHYTASPVNDKLSRQYNVIPSINIGKIFCNRYHVYLGLGLAISRFKLQAQNPLDNVTVSGTQTRLGFAPSLGLEYAATQNLSIVGAVGYEMYQRVKKTFNASQMFGNNGATYSTSISPRYLTLKVGAVYRF